MAFNSDTADQILELLKLSDQQDTGEVILSQITDLKNPPDRLPDFDAQQCEQTLGYLSKKSVSQNHIDESRLTITFPLLGLRPPELGMSGGLSLESDGEERAQFR